MSFNGFTGLSNIIADNNLLIGFVLVGSFLIWKFIIEPIINENEPIPGNPETKDQD